MCLCKHDDPPEKPTGKNFGVSGATVGYIEAKASKMATKHVLDILAVYEAGFPVTFPWLKLGL